jgi:hypothetical protein
MKILWIHQQAETGTSHRFEGGTTPKAEHRAIRPVGARHPVRRKCMTRFKILGAAAILSSALASPAMAQQVISNPGYCAQFYPNANCQNTGPGNPYTGSYQRQTYRGQAYRQNGTWQNSTWQNRYNRWDDRDRGFWPGEVAAGVVGGAVGTAAAVATAPFRNSDAYAYYNEPTYDDSYYVERRVSRRPACGIQPGATYMGADGRWYPC